MEIQDLIPLYCDNKSTIHMLENLLYCKITKYIDVDCCFVGDYHRKVFSFHP